jgi:uncharacterized integral membrane protein (TIGR00698 family)
LTKNPDDANRNGVTRANELSRAVRSVSSILPGFALTALIAWLGLRSSDWLGRGVMGFAKSPISGIMMAILIGLVVANSVRLPKAFKPGIAFSQKKVLRLGIILLGIRLSIGDVVKLGASSIPVIVVCIAGGLLVASWLSRRLTLSSRLGTLIAVGTSICGASAIVATGPAIEAKEEEVAYAVANITLFGIVAMLVYPYVAHAVFGGNPTQAGLFLGTSIHETAQVAGSGLIYKQLFDSPKALDAATVAKLVRNLFMAIVIPLMAYLHHRRSTDENRKRVSVASLFPLFILGFVLMAVLRSVGDATVSGGAAFGLLDKATWSALVKGLDTWAGNLLAAAMAAVGLATSVRQFKGLGLRPFYAGLGAAVSVGVLSILGICVVGWLVGG